MDTFSFKSAIEIQASDWSCSFPRAYWPSIRLVMTFDLHYLAPDSSSTMTYNDVTASNRVNLVDPVLAPENRARPIRFKILNLLLSNALFSVRALIAGRTIFAVVRDVFFVIIAFRANNSLYARPPDPSFLVIEGCGARD